MFVYFFLSQKKRKIIPTKGPRKTKQNGRALLTYEGHGLHVMIKKQFSLNQILIIIHLNLFLLVFLTVSVPRPLLTYCEK